MTEEVKQTNAGRPRHPKWDEMHDLDRYLKLVDIQAQNLVTGKWKKLPPGFRDALDRMREILVNKYPDYFKVVEPKFVTPAIEELEAAEEQPPLKTLESPKEEPAFIAQPFPKD